VREPASEISRHDVEARLRGQRSHGRFRGYMPRSALLLCVLAAACTSSQEARKPTSTPAAKSRPKTAFTPEGTVIAPADTLEAKITVPENAGPAAKLVQSFFENWKGKRFEEMHRQLADAPTPEALRNALLRTPVRWNSVEILEETGKGDNKDVSISIEVTDLPSVMAAYVFNYAENSPVHDELSEANPYPVKPHGLGIETFCKIKQTWRVIAKGSDYQIQIGKDRENNILCYFIDAGTRSYSSSSGSAETLRIHMARVMVLLSEPLGMNTDEVNAVIPEIKTKAELGAKYFRETPRVKNSGVTPAKE